MVRCANNHENLDGSAFCNSCGIAISAPEQAALSETAPAGASGTRTLSSTQGAPWRRYAVFGLLALLLITTAVVVGISVTNAIATSQREAKEEADAQAAAEEEAERLKVFYKAVRACGLSDVVQDKGRSAFLDNSGNDFGSGSLSVSDVVCFLGELDTPDSVITHISNTRSLDGTQSDSWGNFTASWTYHPDDGLDVIIKLVDP